MNLRTLAAVAAVGLLGGCETHGKIEPLSGPPMDKEAYFVLGLQPAFTRMAITDGTISDGHFNISMAVRMWGINVPYEGIVQDGYFIGRVPAGRPLAIQFLQLFNSRGALLGPVYRACTGDDDTFGNRKWFVFQLAPGQVAYIADLHLAPGPRDSIVATVSTDLEAARAFVSARYPALHLEQGSYQRLGC